VRRRRFSLSIRELALLVAIVALILSLGLQRRAVVRLLDESELLESERLGLLDALEMERWRRGLVERERDEAIETLEMERADGATTGDGP
jgi:hypothetical protein